MKVVTVILLALVLTGCAGYSQLSITCKQVGGEMYANPFDGVRCMKEVKLSVVPETITP